jgi:hypothetical protein
VDECLVLVGLMAVVEGVDDAVLVFPKKLVLLFSQHLKNHSQNYEQVC